MLWKRRTAPPRGPRDLGLTAARSVRQQTGTRAVRDADPLVRIHAVKAVSEMPWGEGERFLAQKLLADEDPFVRRAAAEVLGLHPDLRNIDPLVELWRTTDASDTMLVHVTRIALRNTIRSASGRQWDELQQRYQAAADTQARLIDVCMGIHTPAAAGSRSPS